MRGLVVAPVPIEGPSAQRTWFDTLPADVYVHDPLWSPASATVSTQIFADAQAGNVRMHPLVALRSGRPVARAAGIIRGGVLEDRSGNSEGWLGLVECRSDDSEAGQFVIQGVLGWLHKQGCSEVVGTRTSSLMSGLLVAGFDRPQVILTPYNPPWYAELFAACGFRETSASVALEFSRERVPRFLGLPDPRVRLRHLDPGRLVEDLERIRLFQHDTFAGRPGHLDRTSEQMQRLVAQLGAGLDPELAIIAEDRAGHTVGVLICLPDVWQSRPPGVDPDRARLLTIGVTQGWRGRGVAVAMGRSLTRALLRKGYQTLEASWVRRENLRPQLLARALGARETRRFALLAWHADGARG